MQKLHFSYASFPGAISNKFYNFYSMCYVWQCVAMCDDVFQCAMCCYVWLYVAMCDGVLPCAAMYGNVLLCVTICSCVEYVFLGVRMCFEVWGCVSRCEDVFLGVRICFLVWGCVSRCEDVLLCVRIFCYVWQCVSMCYVLLYVVMCDVGCHVLLYMPMCCYSRVYTTSLGLALARPR
jgi:hypothetical protein